MKKSLIVTSLLMACVFIFIGCGNLSPGTSVISGITFERDQYTISLPLEINSIASRNIAPSDIEINKEWDDIKTLLQSVFPNGELTILANGLGFTYTPTSGDNWEITDDQWDEFEDKLDDVKVTISGQDYEAEFERHDRTGDIEVELDPIIKYPQTVSKVRIIDDTTGEEVTDSNLLKKVTDLIGNHFGSTAWENGSVDFDKTFSTEAEFENFEDTFENQVTDEFTFNGKEYELGLEEPFKGTLIIEVELEDDDDDDD